MEKKDPSNVSIKNDKGEYEPLQPKHFTGKNGEREFSNLLIQNPEIFPKKWYEPEGSEWMPISVEVNLDTGFLDILGIDDAGGIYVIESKLDSNSDKKTVRQQATDYTYALLKLAEKPSGWKEFCDKIKTANKSEKCKEQNYGFHNQNLKEIIENNWKENSERCLEGIENNFKNGNYTLVIAIDIIPKKLRISIDGQNQIDAKHKIPVFALEMNEFTTKSNEKIVVTSTYPYDLAEIKEKKSTARGEANDKEGFERRFAITAKTWADKDRRIFNEVRKVIEKPAKGKIFYGTGANNPIIYPKYDTIADGDRAPVSLGSDGCFQFKLDAVRGYVKNTGPGQPTKESEVWEKQISSIPELKKFYEKRGGGSYLKPEEWMPVHEEIIKILKVLIA